VKLRALALLIPALASAQWKFAVSGDSRNCGDIVMPAIAQGVKSSGAEFYWHLGDFRAIYNFDEDIVPPRELNLPSRPLTIQDYENRAWPDFIEHQLAPFGDLPVHLGLGNHETIPPATREKALIQFADWFDSPQLRAQRLKDDPRDHMLRGYYHWIQHGVDFITLDNASTDQFDRAQLRWIHAAIERDEKSPEIHTIIVGMHEALPGSIGESHSMSDSAQGTASGREVYAALWHARDAAHKNVYVIASHSHFFMPDVFNTAAWKGKVLPGWIIGTAGAVRYRLPKDAPAEAKTNVYGYLTGTVAPDGTVRMSFVQLDRDQIERAVQGRYAPELIRWCYEQNRQQ
jgi:hypothetical protein